MTHIENNQNIYQLNEPQHETKFSSHYLNALMLGVSVILIAIGFINNFFALNLFSLTIGVLFIKNVYSVISSLRKTPQNIAPENTQTPKEVPTVVSVQLNTASQKTYSRHSS